MESRQTPMEVTTETAHQVKEHARRLADAVKERAIASTDGKKSVLSKQVGTLAEKLEQAGKHEEGSEPTVNAELVSRGVGLLRKIGETLESNSTEDLLARAEEEIRARPGLLIGACVALGFIGARLVRK